MTTNVRVGDTFPDFELPDHRQRARRLSGYTRPSPLDEKLGFDDGYPLILVFGRGFFCPRDQEQMRGLVRFQLELSVNYCKLVTVSADPPMVGAAFRAGLGAEWPFLSDEGREVIRRINILDETEGEYARTAQPYTFVLKPDLTIHRIYDVWFFVGRPTLEELRRDLREIMEIRKSGSKPSQSTRITCSGRTVWGLPSERRKSSQEAGTAVATTVAAALRQDLASGEPHLIFSMFRDAPSPARILWARRGARGRGRGTSGSRRRLGARRAAADRPPTPAGGCVCSAHQACRTPLSGSPTSAGRQLPTLML